MWNQQFNSADEGESLRPVKKPIPTEIPSNAFRVKRRRQLYSSRMQQTVWALLDRKALTMDIM